MRFLACPECGWVYLAPPSGVAVCNRRGCPGDGKELLRPATDEEALLVHVKSGGFAPIYFASVRETSEPDAEPGEAEPQVDLSSWRTMRPRDLVRHRDELLNLLISKTGAADDRTRIILIKAAGGNDDAMLAAADMIGYPASDLCLSWLCCAVLFGSTVARIQLAAKIASYRPWYSTEQEVKRCWLLAREWITPLLAQFTRMGDGRVKFLSGLLDSGLPLLQATLDASAAAAAASKPAARTAAVTAETDADGGPALLVCSEIPAVRNDRDDKAFVQAWSCLTTPLPLIQGPPAETVMTALELEFPWAEEAIEVIGADLELRERMGLPWSGFRPTLLVGPPGTGKTSLARRLGETLGVGYGAMSAAGSSDNRLLAGTARGWASAMPSFVLQVMRRAGCANPLILMDELDKTRPDGRNGDLRQTMLSMLEPATARRWLDEALTVPVDISAVSWIITANDAAPLRGPLLTRLRQVTVSAPRPEHIEAVLAGVRRDLAAQFQVAVSDLPELPDEAEDVIRAGCRRQISLRRVRAAYERALLTADGPRQGGLH